ncbi:MAG: DeoR/GlpR transcriptional regulator [Erysipelotrichaceae bacterium]|nr:DeoR/GlpR transcriptional regulator [Erysipelotrichaceae bacterium]
MNKRDLRVKSIVKDLLLQPNQTNAHLAKKYNVSTMTIRRDLEYIEKNHLLDSMAANFSTDNYESKIEEIKNAAKKQRIAEYAVSLIEPNEVIVLDTGTTAGMIASLLPNDIPLTVICYSYHILSKLYDKENIRLVLAGGYYHHNTQTFESPEAVSFLEKFRAKKMFVCASGVHEELGLTCADQRIAPNKQASIETSLTKILVVDSSKFGLISAGYFAPIDQMDIIITDDQITPEWKERIEEMDIDFHIV